MVFDLEGFAHFQQQKLAGFLQTVQIEKNRAEKSQDTGPGFNEINEFMIKYAIQREEKHQAKEGMQKPGPRKSIDEFMRDLIKSHFEDQ